MISSVIPSLKYSLSGSALMFTKGRTAMDLPEYVWNRLVFKASTQFMGAIPEVAANGKHDADVENIGSH